MSLSRAAAELAALADPADNGIDLARLTDAPGEPRTRSRV
jgi:hypothetical protein